jgi:hypothetical protein
MRRRGGTRRNLHGPVFTPALFVLLPIRAIREIRGTREAELTTDHTDFTDMKPYAVASLATLGISHTFTCVSGARQLTVTECGETDLSDFAPLGVSPILSPKKGTTHQAAITFDILGLPGLTVPLFMARLRQ